MSRLKVVWTSQFKKDYKAAMKLALENPPDVVKIVIDCQ